MNNEIRKDELYDNILGDEYKNTFNEIHASENLLRKVKEMKNDSKQNIFASPGRKAKVGYGFAALLAVFVLSNVGVCAATGETWIEKAYISITADSTQQIADTGKDAAADDNDVLSVASVETSDDVDITEPDFVFETNDMQTLFSSGSISEEDGRTYFYFGGEKKDVTDEIVNGEFTATAEVNGTLFVFSIGNDLTNEYGESYSYVSFTFEGDDYTGAEDITFVVEFPDGAVATAAVCGTEHQDSSTDYNIEDFDFDID